MTEFYEKVRIWWLRIFDGVGAGIEEARAFGSWKEEGILRFLCMASRTALIGIVLFV